MSLSRVWIRSLSDGLIRADQVVGISAHQTPALTGKPARWLLDIVLGTSIGSGHRDGWMMTALHRTLVQSGHDPTPAATALARLLAQLDAINAAGVVTATVETDPAAEGDAAVAGGVRLRFLPFSEPEPGRHTGIEYL